MDDGRPGTRRDRSPVPGISDLAVPGDDPRVFPKYFFNIFSDFTDEDVPIKPEGLKTFLERARALGKESPTS